MSRTREKGHPFDIQALMIDTFICTENESAKVEQYSLQQRQESLDQLIDYILHEIIMSRTRDG